jgi:hypothetical protein
VPEPTIYVNGFEYSPPSLLLESNSFPSKNVPTYKIETLAPSFGVDDPSKSSEPSLINLTLSTP